MNRGLRTELKRKAFHLLSGGYALLFTMTGRETSLWVLGSLLLVVGVLETIRLRVASLNNFLLKVFGGIHRAAEERQPSGIFWTLAGCVATVWLIPVDDIVLTALWYLALGDAAASLVGRTWGHVRLGSKSLEGTLSCFVVCWFVGSVCLQAPFGSVEIVVGALVAALAELLPLPFNDNLWIPTLSGASLYTLRVLAG